MYKLTLTRQAEKFYDQADTPLVRRLNRCIDQLIKNLNIKRLRGSLYRASVRLPSNHDQGSDPRNYSDAYLGAYGRCGCFTTNTSN